MFDDAFTSETISASVSTGPCRDSAAERSTRQPTRPAVTLNDIRELAQSKWLAAGRPEGDGMRFWLEAEQELLHERAWP